MGRVKVCVCACACVHVRMRDSSVLDNITYYNTTSLSNPTLCFIVSLHVVKKSESSPLSKC